jgi:hypothetical protein
MGAKYIPPFVQEDGTFWVVVTFTTAQNAEGLHDPVTQWCEEWITNNLHWEPVTPEEVWKADKGPWNYFEIFTGAPYVVKAEDHDLWLRFDARLYSYWWRDWFVFLVSHLRQAFPELQPQGRWLAFNGEMRGN